MRSSLAKSIVFATKEKLENRRQADRALVYVMRGRYRVALVTRAISSPLTFRACPNIPPALGSRASEYFLSLIDG